MAKSVKKYLAVLTAFLVIFSNFNGIAAHAASAEVNQSVSIKVNKSEAKPNEEVLVSVTANLENVAAINVNYQLPNDKYTGVATKYNPSTGDYEAAIPVKDYSEAGQWTAAGVDIYYKNGASDEILSDEVDLSQGDFTIVNENNSIKDTAKPIFKGVTVDKAEAKPGDSVKVSVDASDDLSGISQIRLTYDAYGTKSAIATYNEGTKKYEATLEVQEYDHPGEWSLSEVYIRDYAGNSYSNYYGSDLASGNFTIQNENVDETAPVLNGVTVDKKEASAGDTVTWSFDLSDDKSGVGSVNVTYYNPADRYNYQYGVAKYNTETKKYELKVPITADTMIGDWKIRYLNVSDIAGNNATIADSTIYSWGTFDFSPGNFKVMENTQGTDTTAPVVNSISVDKQEVNYGEEVTASLDITDNGSGTDTVYVEYENENYGYLNQKAVYNTETKKYEVKFPITYTTNSGKWRIVHISVTDNQNNTNDYYEGGELDLSAGDFTVLTDNKDEAAPVINGVTVDKSTAQPGENVKVSIDASDDKSGIQYMYVSYNGSNGGYWNGEAVYNAETKKYEFEMNIDENTMPGEWSISQIYVYDQAQNTGYYSSDDVDLSGGNFTINNDNIDYAAPEVTSVTVDKTEAHPGDTVTISMDAKDDKSGIDSISAYIWKGNESEEQQAVYNSDTGKYEVKVTIDDTARPGTWSINYIYVQDKASNYQWIYPSEENNLTGEFTVINEKADVQPPTVEGVSVDKKEASPGDTVKLSIDAADDKSEINQVTATYYGSNGGSMEVDASYNPETKKYEAQLPVDAETRPGVWTLDYVYVSDSQENSVYVYNEQMYEDGRFTVVNDNIDVNPPVISSVTVDKQEAHPGDTVTVSVDASDEKSQVDYLSVQYQANNRYVEEQEAVYNPESGKYEIKIPVDASSRPGEWTIDSIYARDKENNSERYYSGGDQDFSTGNFTVVNENADITPPTIIGASVNKQEVKPGDSLTVSIEANDDKSGIDDLEVELDGSNGGYLNTEAVYNPETQKYEATVDISEDTRPGEWKIYSIYARDKEDNDTWYYYYDNNELSDANFTVVNDKVDIKAPVINSVSVDKEEAAPGDKVKVSIDASDDKSKIQTVSVEYRVDNRYQGEQEAVYNPDTGKYELTLSFNDQSKPGVWSIASIYVEDEQYNSQRYYNGGDQDFSSGDITVVNENADVTAPVVKGISVDKQEAVPGDTVTLSMDASDDKSKIAQVSVEYSSIYGSSVYQDAEYNSETGKYEVHVPVTEKTKPGVWSIDYIYIEDSEGNYDFVNYYDDVDFSLGQFTVKNDAADITPPAIKSISVDKTEAKPGDTVKVSLDVTDEKSGVGSVYVSFEGSLGGRTLEAEAVYNKETNMYEALLPVTDTTKPGDWKPYYVSVSDQEGNGMINYGDEGLDFSHAAFNVTNEKADITAPIVQGVSVDKKEANPGDTVTVSMDVADDQSGVNYVSVDLYNTAGQSMWAEANYNETTKKYEAKLEISASTRPGTWSIGGIYVLDTEYNSGYYSNGSDDGSDFSQADFTVHNDNFDVTPPSVQGVSVDKKEAQGDDKVTVSIAAKDDQSGINNIYVDYLTPSNSYKETTASYNPETDKYEATIEITSFAKSGKWELQGINVTDNEGNSKYIYNNNDSDGMDLSGGNFVVKNENEDTTAPEVKSIKVNNSQYIPGQSATIDLDVNDSQSGVDYVSVAFSGSNGGYESAQAEYNETTHKYTAEIPVNVDTKPGLWSLQYIYVMDKEGNSQNLNPDVYDFSSVNYTVKNDEADITPPSVTKAAVDKQEAKPGEEVTVSLDVKDDKSQVGDVWAVLRNEDDKNFWGDYNDQVETLVYNDETQKYEAKFPVTDKMKPGTWSLYYVYATDSKGNGQAFIQDEDAVLADAHFTLTNDQADMTPPEYHGISVDKKTVNVGEKVTFSVDASDKQSGIKDVYMVLDGGMDVYSQATYNQETKKYEISIPITKEYKPGVWKVQSIGIYDKENNGINLDSKDVDFSNAEFEIINKDYDSNQDDLADYINSISVDKKEVQPGDNVTLSVNFKDSSNIKDVSVRYVGADGQDFNRDAVYNEKTGNYEVKISVSPLFKPTLWSLASIYVTEKDDNILNLFGNGKVDLSNGDFSVSNSGLDQIAPNAPTVNEVTDHSAAVTGSTEPKVTVIVKNGEQVIGSAVSDYEGLYTVWIDSQKADTVLTVTATDSSGNQSQSTAVTVKDATPPALPIVNEVNDSLKKVSGTAEAGSTVSVTIGTATYTAIADSKGYFEVGIPLQKAGTTITVTAKDAAGNESEAATVTVLDKTAPVKPEVTAISDQDTTVTGTTEAKAVVKVTAAGTEIGSGTADEKGKFTITIKKQPAGTAVKVTAADAAGNVSEAATVTVLDKTAPAAPVVTAVSDQDTTVSGTTEAKAVVTVTAAGTEIGSGTADETGKFTITIGKQQAGTTLNVKVKDAAGNESEAATVTVVDKTAPAVPVVQAVTDQATSVTGTTEANASISVKSGTTEIGKGTADVDGKFSITIPKQTAGTKILVLASDKAGNESSAEVTVSAYYTPVKIQLNGKDFNAGYSANGTVYVYWKALNTFQIPYKYEGNGLFTIEGRSVQSENINGVLYIKWSQLAPGKMTFKTFSGGYNFIYSVITPIKVQLNGKTFTDGISKDGKVYVYWKALNTFNIPYTYKGNGLFTIENRSVQAENINGVLYLRWDQLSPGKVTYQKITGGFNFIYAIPLKVQLNGKSYYDGYSMNGTTYVFYKALNTFKIPYTYKGNNVFTIEGRTVQGQTINGAIYIRWNDLSPGKVTYKKITGGYNFIYTTATPVKVQLNGQAFNNGMSKDGTVYVYWKALNTFKIPYTYNGNGSFTIEGRTVQSEDINGVLYIRWNYLSPKHITFKLIEGGYNFIYNK